MIEEVFFEYFDNLYLRQEGDSAIVASSCGNLALTTDSYVINPLFFPGGDLGKLSVCGTVNDLAVSGATPRYLTAGFILEEGLELDILVSIVKSMKKEAVCAGIKIVAGDTKVVGKGQADKIYINTTGLGFFKENLNVKESNQIENGDVIIISGTPGDHEAAVINAREGIFEQTELISDCASLNGMIQRVLARSEKIKFMRDITRGGLAAILNEISVMANMGLDIDESAIPVSAAVKGFCEMLGYDMYHFASEGKCIFISDRSDADDVLSTLKEKESGKNASIIGTIRKDHPGEVVLKTSIGGRRLMSAPLGTQVPRIC